VYWRWVSTTMIAFVTKTSVFHWPAVHKTGGTQRPLPACSRALWCAAC
jgi:hypothetical protein